ncbi:MAG TPA: TerB family tellurite resistance protein [Gammaproteobacteria bacterium]|nr:TerB family tellurite resistance protein [Gammaproteobacteria bacterium]
MLRAIQDFFHRQIEPDTDAGPDAHGLQLATAALLFEVLRADYDEHPDERMRLEQALQKAFSLSAEETCELAALADREAAEAVSLYQFTGLINRNFSPQQKVDVVEMLWQVAYADGRLDRYEEAAVRKISELLHVSHRDFIRVKHRVLESLQ